MYRNLASSERVTLEPLLEAVIFVSIMYQVVFIMKALYLETLGNVYDYNSSIHYTQIQFSCQYGFLRYTDYNIQCEFG